MNQDINFIYAERQRPNLSLNGRIIIRMVLLSWLIMFTSATYIYIDMQKVQRALEQENNNFIEQQERTSKTEKLYPPVRSNQQFTSRLDKLRSERDTKTKLIELLSSNTSRPTETGFHGLLEGIGQQQTEGLWFKEISIKRVGKHLDMRMVGGATDPSMVPIFIKQLSSNPLFVGSQFSVLGMQRADNDNRYVSFTLVTPDHEGLMTDEETVKEESKS